MTFKHRFIVPRSRSSNRYKIVTAELVSHEGEYYWSKFVFCKYYNVDLETAREEFPYAILVKSDWIKYIANPFCPETPYNPSMEAILHSYIGDEILPRCIVV